MVLQQEENFYHFYGSGGFKCYKMFHFHMVEGNCYDHSSWLKEIVMAISCTENLQRHVLVCVFIYENMNVCVYILWI